VQPRDPKQTERELAVFACFLEAHPSFAADIASYGPAPDDFPDIAVNLKSGSMGFELGEWLHARQMAEAKRKESLRAKLRYVLDPCLGHRPRNFVHVAIDVRDAIFDERDGDPLRGEFSHMVLDVDESWCREPLTQQAGYPLSDFARYPSIGKYVESMLFWPRNPRAERIISKALDNALNDPEITRLLEQSAGEAKAWIEATGYQLADSRQADAWINFPLGGGAYSSESALQALTEILKKKTTRYAGRQTGDLCLIIYYDEAVLYNTPYKDRKRGTFADFAYEAGQFLIGRDTTPFGKIYLLRALRPDPEVFEIWPTFGRCQ
jgi:hypothetical protein